MQNKTKPKSKIVGLANTKNSTNNTSSSIRSKGKCLTNTPTSKKVKSKSNSKSDSSQSKFTCKATMSKFESNKSSSMADFMDNNMTKFNSKVFKNPDLFSRELNKNKFESILNNKQCTKLIKTPSKFNVAQYKSKLTSKLFQVNSSMLATQSKLNEQNQGVHSSLENAPSSIAQPYKKFVPFGSTMSMCEDLKSVSNLVPPGEAHAPPKYKTVNYYEAYFPKVTLSEVMNRISNIDSETSISDNIRLDSKIPEKQSSASDPIMSHCSRQSSQRIPPTSPANRLNSHDDLSRVKRYLITCHTCEGEQSGKVVGIVYGAVESFVNCSTDSNHPLTQAGLVQCFNHSTTGQSRTWIDLCLVDKLDKTKSNVIAELEAKSNLITIVPVVEGRAMIYDESGRGIELRNNALVKLNACAVSVAFATTNNNAISVGNLSCSSALADNVGPKSTYTIHRNVFDSNKAHKIEILNGTANFVFCTEQQQPNSKVIFMLVIHDERDNTVAIDESLFWDKFNPEEEGENRSTNTVKMTNSSYQLKNEDGALSTLSYKSKINADNLRLFDIIDFICTKVIQFPMEYLIYVRSSKSTTMQPVGTIVGQLDGHITKNQAFFLDDNDLLIQMVIMDYQDAVLMNERRRILQGTKWPLIEIVVTESAFCNIYGDLGGGFIVAGDSLITLCCGQSLFKIKSNTGQKTGTKCKPTTPVQDIYNIESSISRHLILEAGETSVVIKNGDIIAYYQHVN